MTSEFGGGGGKALVEVLQATLLILHHKIPGDRLTERGAGFHATTIPHNCVSHLNIQLQLGGSLQPPFPFLCSIYVSSSQCTHGQLAPC